MISFKRDNNLIWTFFSLKPISIQRKFATIFTNSTKTSYCYENYNFSIVFSNITYTDLKLKNIK